MLSLEIVNSIAAHNVLKVSSMPFTNTTSFGSMMIENFLLMPVSYRLQIVQAILMEPVFIFISQNHYYNQYS